MRAPLCQQMNRNATKPSFLPSVLFPSFFFFVSLSLSLLSPFLFSLSLCLLLFPLSPALCLFVHKLPSSLSEHLSMDQALYTLIQRDHTLCVVRALVPFWSLDHRMCVIVRRLDCLRWFAHATRQDIPSEPFYWKPLTSITSFENWRQFPLRLDCHARVLQRVFFAASGAICPQPRIHAHAHALH